MAAEAECFGPAAWQQNGNISTESNGFELIESYG
ncbi:hypothetical protein MIPYR_40043 [uncultured Microbacterium sp.]|uniref:Uncharacterized protein n=1 Tax=uncultured Microbacterium sp. TaxID=191216 RepID=A0A1Y5P3H3_9MICO|nr:hypothetical protein MIPYR_40043 [uncultured Microbacterium sp.]